MPSAAACLTITALLPPLRWAGGLRARWWAADVARPAWQGRLWGLVLAALLVWLARQLGAADWYTDYPLPRPGAPTQPEGPRLPTTFASIDHPFHLAKERATVDALRRGWLPRWFANHQGGFPTEFYPAGGDAIVALVYFLGLGLLPLAICHKLVLIGVLFVPPLAYCALARRERLPLSVAVLAAVLHLFVRGTWWGGGSRELIDMGLWANVLAATLPLLLILWGADYLRRGDRRGLLLATGAATLAVYTNPRAIFGIVAAGAALGLVAASEHLRLWPVVARLRGWPRRATMTHGHASAVRAWQHPLALLAGRAALATLLVGLLSAALLLPLRAHQHLYHFTHFLHFASARQVWHDYQEALGWPLIPLAGLGLGLGLLRRGFYSRVIALLLPLSYLVVTLAGWHFQDQPVFAQLEGPRLMPLLRPPTLFLAALGAHETLRTLLRLVRLPGATMLTGGLTVALAVWLLLAPRSPLDREHYGLPLEETTNQPAFTAIAQAALTFAAASTPADKPLIIGNPLSSHASFWVPALTGRAVYHHDWLWFWRTVAYASPDVLADARSPLVLADERGALEREFLARHGLTMLLLDARRGDLLALAATKPYLWPLDPGVPGGYAIYRVDPAAGVPNGWITLSSGAISALDVRPEHLAAWGHTDRAGVARIIVNAFPRWRARVNGEPAPIVPSEEGYMLVVVPAGEVSLVLDYTTVPVDWLARGLVTLGLLLLLGLTVPRGRRRARAG